MCDVTVSKRYASPAVTHPVLAFQHRSSASVLQSGDYARAFAQFFNVNFQVFWQGLIPVLRGFTAIFPHVVVPDSLSPFVKSLLLTLQQFGLKRQQTRTLAAEMSSCEPPKFLFSFHTRRMRSIFVMAMTPCVLQSTKRKIMLTGASPPCRFQDLANTRVSVCFLQRNGQTPETRRHGCLILSVIT